MPVPVPRSRKRGSAAARLLRDCGFESRMVWIFNCYECCVLSGRVLCVKLTVRQRRTTYCDESLCVI